MIYVDAERLQIRKICEKRIQMSVTRYDTDDTDFLPSVFYSEIYRTSWQLRKFDALAVYHISIT